MTPPDATPVFLGAAVEEVRSKVEHFVSATGPKGRWEGQPKFTSAKHFLDKS